MRPDRTPWTAALVGLGLVAVACGGGGSSVIVTGLFADFTADAPSAAPRISMEAGPGSGDVFTVEIHADSVANLYGVAFTLIYDPAISTFLGCDGAGSILTTSPAAAIDCDDTLVGGAKFSAALENDLPGKINVRASRDGLVPGVAAGDGRLVTLTFRAEEQVAAEPFVFEAGPSREVEVCPPGGPPLPACTTPTLPFDEGTLDVSAG